MEHDTAMTQKEESNDRLMNTAQILQLEEQLKHAKQQINLIEKTSTEMLELLSKSKEESNFVAKVVELSDSLQESAGIVESNLTSIVARLPEQDVRLETVKQAVAREVSDDQATLSKIDQCTKNLLSVLDFTRSVTSLSVSCVTYPDQAFSLLDELSPQTLSTGEEILLQAKEVVLEAPAVFRASVAIREGRNPQPLAVAVYSVDEPNSSKGAWGNSDFIVFRRVSAIADQALTYFRQQAEQKGDPSSLVLLQLLLWLSSYKRLFSEECNVLQAILACDTASQSLIPPVYRRFRMTSVELVQAARHSAAYHLHVVPQEVL